MTAPKAQPPGALGGSADRAACETDGTASITPEEARRKAWITWQARAALRGHQLRRMADGRWLAFRHGWSRELEEADVEAWLQRIGAPG
ncbi:MAG: hypothetical protein H6933_04840 [Burkholderiaceae bacterium]|nr:hypothetical protein [Rhodoferax sp.]MCP5284207.1 hypothetical protein [Burkholderiaceae bacterium]